MTAHPSSANETEEIPLLFGAMLPAAFDTSWPSCKLGREVDRLAKAAPRGKARINEDDAKNERDISESACCSDHGTCQLVDDRCSQAKDSLFGNELMMQSRDTRWVNLFGG